MPMPMPMSMPMPMMGLGTYQMKGDVAVDAVIAALECGYRMIDTARVYRNEKDIGRGLKIGMGTLGLSRSDIYITSKISPNDQGDEKAYNAIVSSLKDLDVQYLDLILIHWPGVSKTPLDSELNSQLRRASWAALMRA